jgi:hypothetical protein
LAKTAEWFKGFFVVGVVFGVLTFFFTNKIYLAFWAFVGFIIVTTAYAFFTRCKKCENCFAIAEINNRLIDTNVTHVPFTKQVEVGRTERHYHYVDGGSRQTHTEINYEKRKFVKEITRSRYEHTHQCKFCRNITHTYTISEQSQTYPA